MLSTLFAKIDFLAEEKYGIINDATFLEKTTGENDE